MYRIYVALDIEREKERRTFGSKGKGDRLIFYLIVIYMFSLSASNISAETYKVFT